MRHGRGECYMRFIQEAPRIRIIGRRLLAIASWAMKSKSRIHLAGLEVDAGPAGLQYAYDGDSIPIVYGSNPANPVPLEKRAAQKVAELPADEAQRRSRLRIQGRTIRLSVALAVSVAFAIVAAALAISMAYKLERANTQITILKTQPSQSNSTNSTQSSFQCANPHPTSSCHSLTSPFTSIYAARYNLYCDTSFPNSDLLSVWVDAFEHCIHACTSYSHMGTHNGSACVGVMYSWTAHPGTMADNYDDGNCFLKAQSLEKGRSFSDLGVDSAILV
ncbi:hypothetical protein MMC21_007688 [Puttea exsequens]|nr:hypothetical protein [Puttea exsequens]